MSAMSVKSIGVCWLVFETTLPKVLFSISKMESEIWQIFVSSWSSNDLKVL